jgi:hypothetical protein
MVRNESADCRDGDHHERAFRKVISFHGRHDIPSEHQSTELRDRLDLRWGESPRLEAVSIKLVGGVGIQQEQNGSVGIFFRRHTVSTEQVNFYRDHGFVLVSGLVKPGVVDRGRHELETRSQGNGSGSLHQVLAAPALVRCVPREVCDAAGDLESIRERLVAPRTVYTIVVYPENSPWEWPTPHIDHAKPEDSHRVLPPPFRIGCLVYLNDVVLNAGATVVWPESHRQLAALASSDPKKYEFMWPLNQDIGKLPLNAPVQIVAEAGDVLFYHYLCAHSGSRNTGTSRRFALNHKW